MPASDRYPTLTEPCMAETCAHEQVYNMPESWRLGFERVMWKCPRAAEHERWKCQRPKDKCEIHLNRSAIW